MNLFGRKHHPQPQPEAPIVITDADLPHVGQVVDNFLGAVGNDAALHFRGRELAVASGAPTMDDIVVGRAPSSGLDRPWRWLASAAEQADRAGDYLLVARIALLVTFWATTLEPRMGLGNHLEMRLDNPPPEVASRIYTAGLRAIPHLPEDSVIIEHPTGTVTAASLLASCTAQLGPR
ncbi:hypothetical protein ACIRU8_27145 [Streptomyces sp. NPDC101175]|uniref:hypothetical protein n=1 Tax=Streptomyces sp. NPDC101175 TaxID=3366123 RepID=UPI003838AAD6